MDTPTDDVIAELRFARVCAGIAQSEVARRMNTTQSAIARLESAQSDPRLSTLQRYLHAMGARLAVVPAISLDIVASEVRDELTAGDADGALRSVIQFLDDLYRLPAGSRGQALRVEPESVGDQRWDALLAGVTEYACHRLDLAIPGWTAAPGRFLSRFWFVIEDILGRPMPGLAALAFVRSPAELASRGVFIDGDSLVSV